jgi:hypothetical protein
LLEEFDKGALAWTMALSCSLSARIVISVKFGPIMMGEHKFFAYTSLMPIEVRYNRFQRLLLNRIAHYLSFCLPNASSPSHPDSPAFAKNVR